MAYREQKIEKKWKKLDRFARSWKLAFESLKKETGLIFVHLNKTDHLHKQLTLYDKIGQKHMINLDQMEFCVQHRAQMLCEALLDYKAQENLIEACQLVNRLLQMILSEYSRGLADNDHALMQNTGVVRGQPVHIDVGQFVCDEALKKNEIYFQELFTKTYKFKLWLHIHYPELEEYLNQELHRIIGPTYWVMQPKWREK